MGVNFFKGDRMNWNNVSLVVLGLAAFFGAFFVALWASLVIWTFRDMRARTRDAFAQFLASLMVLVLGPFGIILYLILRPRESLAEKYERSLEEEALLQDIEERQICPGCKQPIQPDYVLCPICHTHLRTPCIHCSRLIHPRWSLCPYCGQGQKPIPGLEGAGNVSLQDLEMEPGMPAAELEPAVPLDRDDAPEFALPAFGGLEPEPQELPPDMAAELQKEADASRTPTYDDPLPEVVEEKTTREPELPEADQVEQTADAKPTAAEPADRDTTEVHPDTDKGRQIRQPLSLFRRQ
jgi:RNA polymerase subunit RPABC4/transcription elongation factor Spt4